MPRPTFTRSASSTRSTRRLAPPASRRVRPLPAALVAGGLLLAACGSDDGNGEPAAPVTGADDTPMADMMGAFGPACEAVPDDGPGSFEGMADEPAATAASANPLLSTLVAAVGEAGLVDTLNGDGPFTIFAPTDDAFAEIDPDTLNTVLGDEDLLTEILTYHVVAGDSFSASDLADEGTVETVQGDTITIGADGTVVNGVDVLCSDVSTANATVHIIGEVLLPPDVAAAMTAGNGAEAAMGPSGPACAAVPDDGPGSFEGMADEPAATAASNNPLLSTLVAAVGEAGLVDTLNGDGPFTIFAPTDDAFAAIPPADLEAVLADQDLLTEILTYHVVAGEQLSSAGLAERGEVTTVSGGTVEIVAAGGGIEVNGASSLCVDVPTANATVHLIDTVLMP